MAVGKEALLTTFQKTKQGKQQPLINTYPLQD